MGFQCIETCILSPNSCGQGFSTYVARNPHYNTFLNNGWRYSHTTRIHQTGGTSYLSHTFVCELDESWRAGVCDTPGNRVGFSRAGSGREFVCFGSQVLKYIKRKNTECRRDV